MNDPFFDEVTSPYALGAFHHYAWDDDGDFDDLYGNAPNKSVVGKATSTAAAAGPHFTNTDMHARQPQVAPVSARSSVDNGAYSYPVSPVSSIPSTTYSRSDAGGGGISNGGGATSGGRASESANRRANQQTAKQKKQSEKAKNASRRAGDGGSTGGREQKIRRKGSEELFNVDWDDDDAVKVCFLCSSSFSLMKRKHHCRHCGHVMCSDCSVFRYFEISHKKHRVCTTCNNELARANRLGDSDADDNLNRSAVTDDDADYAYATPSNSSRKKRSKLRENLKKTFTPKHDKKKEGRQATAQLETKSVVDKKTERADQFVQPKQREEDERKQSSDLFDLADDTWFTDPLVGGNGAAKRKDRHLNLDHDEDDFMREENTQSQYSAAQPKQRTTAEAWQDAMSRHTIAANGGARVPPKGVHDSLSIDAYASRGDDEYDHRRARMEMPRPEQQQQLVVARTPTVEPKAQQSESETDGRFSSHGRPTLKESLKDIFHVHGKKSGSEKRKEKEKVKREESSENKGVSPSPPPPANVSRGMLAIGSAQPAVFTQARPTFYDPDVDELVVDDTPGYFDRASRENFRSPAREQRIPTDSSQWRAAPLPKSVEPRAIASDQESYSIVEPPTEVMGGQETGEANKPDTPVSSPESSGHGFTGALKRLFGISGSKTPAKQVNQETPELVRQATDTEKESNDFKNVDKDQMSFPSAVERQISLYESNILQRAGSFDRFSMAENSLVPYHESEQQDQFRYTMASEYASPGGDFRQLNSEQKRVPTFSGAASIRDLSQKKRRDTFDDLFASPKSQANSSSNGASQPARAWNGIGMESPFVVPPTGVDRFDRRKDDFGAYQAHEITGLTPSIYAIDRSRASSIGLGESSLSSQRGNGEPSQTAGNSWSAISAEPSYGVATYAVPSSVSVDRFASSYARDDQGYTAGPSAHTSIMDDINYRVSGAPRSAQQTNSVDDIFAEFERPNDYVFDPVTGGYVSASAPKRAREQPTKRDYNPQPSKQEPRSQMYNRELALGQSEQYDSRPAAAESENEDGLNDTIVDKISSLEGELAALKQLIRKRKDHDHPVSTSRNSQATTHRSSSNQAVPPRANDQSSRKLSIFDHDSSDEDVVVRKKNGKNSTKGKGTLEVSPIKGSRTSQKKKTKRRDSFAGLFEDSPTEDTALGGRGYESLFQTGSGKESGSDGEDAPQRQLRNGSVKTSTKTSIGRKNAQRVAEEFDDEEDYPSLKPRGRGARYLEEEEEEDYSSLKNRSKSSSQRKTEKPFFRAAVDSVSLSDEEEKPISQVKASPKPTNSKERRPKKPAKPSRVEFDPIDALFDSSSERDVTNFFDIGDKKITPEESRDQNADDIKVESFEDEDSKHTQGTNSSDLTTQEEISATEEADSDEEFALSLAKAKKRRSQPEPHSAPETIVFTGPSQAKKETSVSGDDSEIDSDKEFALSLKKGRSSVLKLASPDVSPVFSDSTSSEPALQESNQPIATDEVNVIDSDEEFALSLKTKKVSRGKSVSFFDQPKEEIESSPPTLESFDEMFKSRDSAEESELSAAADQYNLLDDLDSVVSSTLRAEPNLADEAEVIDQRMKEFSVSEESAIESTQDSTGELGLDPSSSENESAFKSPVRVVGPEPVQVVNIPAGAITVVVEDSTSKADPVMSLGRKSTHILGLEDVSLGIFDQSTDVYSVSLGSSDVVDEESERESGGEDAYSETFSFEVKPKKRAVQVQLPLADTLQPKKKPVEDDGEGLILGKYASGAPAQQQTSTESSIEIALQELTATEHAVSSPLDADVLPLELNEIKAEADWQQMQEQEKERRKKLQLKQRQAQRDKLLKKQGASSKQLSAPNSSSSASSSSTGEKKKKKKDKSAPEAGTPSGSRKKSSSSKKHRHKSHADEEGEQSKENIDSSTTSTLTEL